MDYIAIRKDDAVLENDGLLIFAKAGDLILWDSRTVHCNSPALTYSEYYYDSTATTSVLPNYSSDAKIGDNIGSASMSTTCDMDIIRLAAYVCMLPVSHANDRCLEQRKLGFTRRISTSHWPTQKIGINMKRIVEDPIDPKTCSDAMLALVGYSRAERDDMLSLQML
jgi:hypothetical protein